MSTSAAEPHPAFPSFRASPSDSRIPVKAPTATELRAIIGQSNSLTTIRSTLIPALERAAKEKDQAPLLQSEEKLEDLPDADLPALSVALVYILTARLTQANEDKKADRGLIDLCDRFIANSDTEQLRLCLPRVTQLSWARLRHAQICKNVEASIEPLFNLTLAAPYLRSMTGSHGAFLEACLLTRQYNGTQAMIYDVYTDFTRAGCTYLDILTFHHHAGLITAAQQDFNKANELFLVATSIPTRTASAIQVAAGKRAILCELLLTGKSLRFKQSTSSNVTMAIEKASTEYTNMAKAFAEEKWDAVYRQAEEGKKVFEQDCNSGLVHQVVGSIIKRKILKARGIYSRLTVDQLLVKVAGNQPTTTDDLLSVLRGMIGRGELKATVSDSSPSIVTFIEDNSARGGDALAQLAQSRQLASYLESHLTATGKNLGLDPKYLRKQAGIIDASNGKKDADDFDMLGVGGSGRGGVGGPVRGVATNLDDMGF